jgi:hypothetical protein
VLISGWNIRYYPTKKKKGRENKITLKLSEHNFRVTKFYQPFDSIILSAPAFLVTRWQDYNSEGADKASAVFDKRKIWTIRNLGSEFMTKAKIVGEHHTSSKMQEELMRMIESEKYDAIFIEGREDKILERDRKTQLWLYILSFRMGRMVTSPKIILCI